MDTDLGMSSDQYSIALVVFFITVRSVKCEGPVAGPS